MCRKTVALLLTLTMVLGCVSALAENTKNERVYAVMAADGTLKTLTDNIRLENADGLDEITDRTLLTGIQNVNGKESFALDGETLTWQAQGKDITYQGTSDKTLPVTPVVTLRLDGEEISAEALAEKTGRAEMTVSYTQAETVPLLAATVLLLPENGISNLTLENASVISLSGRQAVVGWGVPGADEALGLPSSFTVRFDADHAKLGWMMSFASADPIDMACREIGSRIDFDLRTEMGEAASILTALEKGEALPETAGKTKELSVKINGLNNGLTALNDGAQKVSDGAAALNTGLAAISGNSEALNNGADAVMTATLNAANEQIKASGLAEAGLTMPELTAENYQEILGTAIGQLDLLGAVSEQAKAGADRLKALLEQLTQLDTFVKGVHAYTGGVDQAAAGAKELAAGALALHDEGTDTLKTGIFGAEKQAADTLLPILENQLATAVRVYEETGVQVQNSGYDLRPEGMKTVTLYVIRTDL